jgi:hypothetical protein
MRERHLSPLSQAVFLVMSAARSGGAHTIGSLSPVWMVRVSRSQMRMVPQPALVDQARSPLRDGEADRPPYAA